MMKHWILSFRSNAMHIGKESEGANNNEIDDANMANDTIQNNTRCQIFPFPKFIQIK